jgi:hypothetical protein
MRALLSKYPKQFFKILLVSIIVLCSLIPYFAEVFTIPQAQTQGSPKVLWVSRVPSEGTVWFISYAIVQNELVAYVLSSGGITFLRLSNGDILRHVNTNITALFALPILYYDNQLNLNADIIAGAGDYLFRISSINGSIVWTRKLSSGVTSGTFLDDVNEDRCWDILVGDSSGNVYLVSGREGSLIWSKNIDSAPIIGIAGMYVYSGSESTNWTVSALKSDGTLKWAKKIGVGIRPILYESYIDSGIDVNGDGYGDVVIATRSSVIMLSGYDGSILWTKPMSVRVTKTLVTSRDFDGDGIYDVILGTRDGVYLLSGISGNVIWSKPLGYVFSIDNFYEVDLNNDGYSEIIVATDKGAYALSGKNGDVVWSYKPASLTTSVEVSWIHSSEEDIDGDGYRDVLVGTNDGYIIALSASNLTTTTTPTITTVTITSTITSTVVSPTTITTAYTITNTATVYVTSPLTTTITSPYTTTIAQTVPTTITTTLHKTETQTLTTTAAMPTTIIVKETIYTSTATITIELFSERTIALGISLVMIAVSTLVRLRLRRR